MINLDIFKEAINIGTNEFLPNGWEVVYWSCHGCPCLFVGDKGVVMNPCNTYKEVRWLYCGDDEEVKQRITEVVLHAYEKKKESEAKRYAEEKEAFRKFIGL